MHPLTTSSQLVFTYPDLYYPRITAKLTEFVKPADGLLGVLEDIRKLNEAARSGDKKMWVGLEERLTAIMRYSD